MQYSNLYAKLKLEGYGKTTLPLYKKKKMQQRFKECFDDKVKELWKKKQIYEPQPKPNW